MKALFCVFLIKETIIQSIYGANYSLLEEAGIVRDKGIWNSTLKETSIRMLLSLSSSPSSTVINWCSCPMADTFTAHWNSCAFLHFPVLCVSVGRVTSSDKWAMKRCGSCRFQPEAFKSWGMMIPFFQLSFLFLEGVHWSGNVIRLRWLGSLLSQRMESSCPGEPPDSQQILCEWQALVGLSTWVLGVLVSVALPVQINAYLRERCSYHPHF